MTGAGLSECATTQYRSVSSARRARSLSDASVSSTAVKVTSVIPTSTSRGVETFFDGKVFDPKSPMAYLDSLAIRHEQGGAG